MIAWTLAVFLLLLVFFKIVQKKFTACSSNKLPPGPWKLPILGHLPFLGFLPHETIFKWKDKYGPIIYIQFGGYPAVVINDEVLIKAAFNMPSFSGRPKLKLLDEVTLNRSGFSISDGPNAKELRMFAQRKLKDFGYGSQFMEVRIQDQIPKLLDVFEKNLSHPMEVRHAFGTIMLNYLWSLVNVLTNYDGHDVAYQEFAANELESATLPPLLALTVFLPKLATWFPVLTGYKQRIDVSKDMLKFIGFQLKHHRQTRIRSEPRDLIDSFLDEMEDSPEIFTENAVLVSLQELLGAGVETNSTTLEWLIYYLVKYPDIQDKAVQEIHANLGTDSFPRYSDRSRLPYCEALLQETFRKTTVVPLSLFHRALEDTEFQGFHIKKDTMVLGNLYAAHNNPNIWDDPSSFRPERFLDENGKPNKMETHLIAFSSGKRKCIGENLARNQMFLFIVSILQSYRLEAAGKLPSEKGKLGLTVACESFQIKVSKRS